MATCAEARMSRSSMLRERQVLMLTAAVALGALGSPTAAQDISHTDPHLEPAARRFESPERFILELRGGPSTPDVTRQSAYGDFFKDDTGPNLGMQLDGIVYRKPKFFYATAGGGISLINFAGDAVAMGTSTAVTEKTTLSLVPLTAMLGLRIDFLARKLRVPVIFAGKIGWEWAHWSTGTGTRHDAAGWSVGPVFAGQIALDLDALEPGGARNLDEEWGINHTYLFGEIYHFSPTKKSLPLGDTNWLIGLGFVL
jgi:hypothetical protein